MQDRIQTERKALFAGAFVYLTMGICGWIAYYLSNSDALLLDGNYNLVNGIASFVGYYVVKIRSTRTHTFPFGQFIYEALYSLVKGILVLGILVAALWENSVKIIDYFAKGEVHEINPTPIALYTVAMVLLSFGLAYFYKTQNRKINNESSMLKTDATTATIDGLLSGFAGGGLLLFLFIGSKVESLAFLQSIGDSIIVLCFVLFALKEPFHIIRANFLELAGGRLQSKTQHEEITRILEEGVGDQLEVADTYISKTGSMYLVVAYVQGSVVTTDYLRERRGELMQKLQALFSNVNVELISR